MTIFFQAAELEDWATVSHYLTGISPSTDSSFFTSANVRQAFRLNSSTEFGFSITSTTFSSNDFWVGFKLRTDQVNVTSHKFLALSGSGTRRIALAQTSTNSQTISAYYWNGSSWTLIGTGAASSFPSTSLSKYDMKVTLGNPGVFRLYHNGAPVITATPDFSFGGLANIDTLNIYNHTNAGDTYFSEVIVADWNTIGSKLVSRIPDANGNYTAWTGAGFSLIDEVQYSTDYMTSGSVDQRASYLLTDFPALATGEAIAGVQLTTWANRDAGGPQNMNHFVRISSTDYDSTNESLNIAPRGVKNILEVSPATAAAWTVTNLNATEFGFRSRT